MSAPPPMRKGDADLARRCAVTINAVRAEQGLPPIKAKVGAGGEILSEARGKAVMRATPNAAEIRNFGRKSLAAAGDFVDHKPGVNRDIMGEVLRTLKRARAPMTVAAIADMINSDRTYARDKLLRLKAQGKIVDGPKVKPTRATRGGGRPAMTFKLAEGS